MNRKNFKDLLTDLYTAYDENHLKYVDGLVDKYIHMPLDAIEMVFFKYNHPSFPHYDPEKSSDDYKMQLFKSYSKGNRIFQGMDVYSEAQKKKEEEQKEEEAKKEEILKKEEELRKRNEEKIESISSDTNRRLDEVGQQLEDQLKDFAKKVEKIIEEKTKQEEAMEIDVILNYKDEEVILPNPKHLTALGKDARIVAKTKEGGKPIGLVIKDIIYDSFSFDDRTLVQIRIDKS